MIYSENLKEIRNEKNLKQQDISNILDIESGTYGMYEREKDIIPINHLNKICNYFNVSLDYILGFTKLKNYYNFKNDINTKLSGERLKALRKEAKLTQMKFGETFHLANTTISDYENGRNPIATAFLYAICKKYKVSADYLLGKIDEPKYFS